MHRHSGGGDRVDTSGDGNGVSGWAKSAKHQWHTRLHRLWQGNSPGSPGKGGSGKGGSGDASRDTEMLSRVEGGGEAAAAVARAPVVALAQAAGVLAQQRK